MGGKKLVRGFGINDADYVVQIKETVGYSAEGKRIQKHTWVCPFYARWSHMINRCYGVRSKNPSYKGCTVCEEWRYFSKFRAWMEPQNWEGKELDKDLICPGNKVYAPELCTFVSKEINAFLTDRRNHRGDYKIGVAKYHNKYRAYISNQKGGMLYLGLYGTEDEAFNAWLTEKLKRANLLASKETNPVVAEALVKYFESYKETC